MGSERPKAKPPLIEPTPLQSVFVTDVEVAVRDGILMFYCITERETFVGTPEPTIERIVIFRAAMLLPDAKRLAMRHVSAVHALFEPQPLALSGKH